MNGKLSRANEVIEELKHKIKSQDSTIESLENAVTKARESAVMLKKIVNDNRLKFEEERLTLYKEHKLEVKRWRKELGEVNRQHHKLEKTFNILKDTELIIKSNVGSKTLAFEKCHPLPEYIESSIQELYKDWKLI